MFPFKKKNDKLEISAGTAAAIAISVLSLCITIGVARWSWYTIEDQILLRQDLNDIRSSQEQLKIQFDFWDEQVSKERMMIRQMKNEMDAAKAAPKPVR